MWVSTARYFAGVTFTRVVPAGSQSVEALMPALVVASHCPRA